MQKKFIEYDLPLYEISEEATHEKHVHIGLPPQFHVWWARKPLASSRATTLAALLKDPGPENPEKREEYRELIKDISPWKNAKKGDSKSLSKAKDILRKQYGNNPPKVLDPFAGGGSIPLEAARLGAQIYSSDYNPVALFIEKATVEWPQEFGIQVKVPQDLQEKENDYGGLSLESSKNEYNLLYFLAKRWTRKIFKKVKREIGQLFSKESSEELVGRGKAAKSQGWVPVGYYYHRTIPCQNPNCEANIPLTSNYWLSRKNDKRIAYRPIIEKGNKAINFEILEGKKLERAIEEGFEPNDGTINRANATCPVCGQVTEANQIRDLAEAKKMDEKMIAVIFHHPDETGKRYRLANEKDIQKFEEAEEHLEEKLEEWPGMEDPLPKEEMVKSSRYMLPTNYGKTSWTELFNSRQQLSLITFVEKIRYSYDQIQEDIKQILRANKNLEVNENLLSKAVIGYLGILLSRLADFDSSMTVWNTQAELVEHTFRRAAIPMAWNYPEVNPFSGSTGSYEAQRRYLLKSLENFFVESESEVHTHQSSATEIPHPNGSFDAILTDPPYYDNVPYAALSDYFYVWLKRSVGEFFPDLFSTPVVPKAEEVTMEPTRHGNKKEAKNFFEN